MRYKIVIDSCGDLTEKLWEDPRIESVPLTLTVGGKEIIDDRSFDQADFLARVAASPECPRSACPSPEAFRKAYDADAERVYCITLPPTLSGSYNSAQLGKKLYLETYPGRQIHVIDSWSACCGETQIALKIMELEEEGHTFEEVVELAEEYKRGLTTYFVLDDLDFLKKNGRLTGAAALVATTFHIKPIMSAFQGVIYKKAQVVGMTRTIAKLAEIIGKETVAAEAKRLMITHVNCPERANTVLKALQEKMRFRDVIIVDSGGCASLYAGNGGGVVTI